MNNEYMPDEAPTVEMDQTSDEATTQNLSHVGDEVPTQAMNRVGDEVPTQAMSLTGDEELTEELSRVSDVDFDTKVLPTAITDSEPTTELSLSDTGVSETDTKVTPIDTGISGTDTEDDLATPLVSSFDTEVLPTVNNTPEQSPEMSRIDTEVSEEDAKTVPIDTQVSRGDMSGSDETVEMAAADGLTVPIGQAAQQNATAAGGPAVPLYATQPPTDQAHVWPGQAPQPNQPFVQVAPQAPPEPLQKTGPSGATIVLGVIALLLGLAGIVFGLRFPNLALTMFNMSPQTTLALALGVIGGLLIVFAALWAIIKAVRGRSKKR